MPRPTVLPTVAIATLLVLSCAASPPTKAPAASARMVAIIDATVIAFDGSPDRVAHTVLIDGETIVSVRPTAEAPPPPGAKIIRAYGFVMPGLVDMHVHLPTDEAGMLAVARASIKAGITTVRSMQGDPAHLAFRRRALDGKEVLPALVLSGPAMSGEMTPEIAAATVRAQHAAGYDAVKILGGFSPAAYEAIAATSRELDIPFAGHLPAGVSLDAALAAPQASIEHLGGYVAIADDVSALERAAAATRERKVFNCPTLGFFANLARSPDELRQLESFVTAPESQRAAWMATHQSPPGIATRVEKMQRALRALAAAGAPLLVGSDSPESFARPGVAYHEELREWVRAGLSPRQALDAATRSAGAFLGQPIGQIAEGMRADLFFLDKDPRESLDHLVPRMVMARGRWLPGPPEIIFFASHARE